MRETKVQAPRVTTKRQALVLAADARSAFVVDETGELHTLTGMTRPDGVKAGTLGSVEYRVGPAYGLWFFTGEGKQ